MTSVRSAATEREMGESTSGVRARGVSEHASRRPGGPGGKALGYQMCLSECLGQGQGAAAFLSCHSRIGSPVAARASWWQPVGRESRNQRVLFTV